MTTEGKYFLTPKEFAQALRELTGVEYTDHTVRRWHHQKKIKGGRTQGFGNRIELPASALSKFKSADN